MFVTFSLFYLSLSVYVFVLFLLILSCSCFRHILVFAVFLLLCSCLYYSECIVVAITVSLFWSTLLYSCFCSSRCVLARMSITVASFCVFVLPWMLFMLCSCYRCKDYFCTCLLPCSFCSVLACIAVIATWLLFVFILITVFLVDVNYCPCIFCWC